MFFFLVQTEQGDIFKITMEVDEDMVSAILFFNGYRFYKWILTTQIFFTFFLCRLLKSAWSILTLFLLRQPCVSSRLAFFLLPQNLEISMYFWSTNYYSILSKLQPTTLYLDMHLLLFICYVCTSFFLIFYDFAVTFNFNIKLMVVFARLYCGCWL